MDHKMYEFLTGLEYFKQKNNELGNKLEELKAKLDNWKCRNPEVKLNMGPVVVEMETAYQQMNDKFKQMNIFFQRVSEKSEAAGFTLESIDEFRSALEEQECTISTIDQDENTTLMHNYDITNGNDSELHIIESTRIENESVLSANNHEPRQAVLFHRSNIKAKSCKIRQANHVTEETNCIEIYQSNEDQAEIGIILHSNQGKTKSQLVKIQANSTVRQVRELEATFLSGSHFYHLKFDAAHARDEFVHCFKDAVDELVKLKTQATSSMPNGNNANLQKQDKEEKPNRYTV